MPLQCNARFYRPATPARRFFLLLFAFILMSIPIATFGQEDAEEVIGPETQEPEKTEETNIPPFAQPDEAKPVQPVKSKAAPPPATATTDPTPAPAPAPEPEPPRKDKDETAAKPMIEKGFKFGSYGRVGFGTTEEGRAAKSYRFVGHPPRLFESSYVEVDLSYVLASAPKKYIKVLMTTAFMANLFHYSGISDMDIAVRNLYLETKGYFADWLTLWVGSRMYRGDDIYLVDYWPMDNLNTIGAGAIFHPGLWDFRLHVGVNRLDDDFQYQEITVSADRFEPRTVIFMDRQRFIVSLKGTRHILSKKNDWTKGGKVSLYGEFHSMAEGYYYQEEEPPEKLPADYGWMFGAQGGMWGFGEGQFLNIWLRVAGGLAAYGELAVPFGLDSAKKSGRAREVVVGLSENFEFSRGGLLAGGYFRYFKDADPNVYDLDDYIEGVFILRLQIYMTNMLHLALEVGESFKRTTGLSSTTPEFDDETGGFSPPKHETPSVTHIGLMFVLSPLGRGTLTRPQIRILGALQAPNAAARHLYPDEDIRSGGGGTMNNLIWYMGVQAEWWFNSSYR